jgi:hypothetical protein
MMRMHDIRDDDDGIERGADPDQSGAVLRSELVRHILRLPDDTRAKLLGFLHLIEDPRLVAADLRVDAGGRIHMSLFSRADPHAAPRPARGSGSEPLQ